MKDVSSNTPKAAKKYDVIAKTEWCIRFGWTNKPYPIAPPPNGCQAVEFHKNLKA